MKKEDLTRGYVRKLAAEIRNAFNYFGDYDEEHIRKSIKEKVKELWQCIGCVLPETIETDDGVVEGYLVSVALGGDETIRWETKDEKQYQVDTTQVLNLVVNKEGFQYVLKSFDSYHLPGTSWDEEFYENMTYKKVKLEEVDKTVLHRW